MIGEGVLDKIAKKKKKKKQFTAYTHSFGGKHWTENKIESPVAQEKMNSHSFGKKYWTATVGKK